MRVVHFIAAILLLFLRVSGVDCRDSGRHTLKHFAFVLVIAFGKYGVS